MSLKRNQSVGIQVPQFRAKTRSEAFLISAMLSSMGGYKNAKSCSTDCSKNRTG